MFSLAKSLFAVTAFAIAIAGVQATPVEKRDNVGDATYYNPALGACGIFNTDNDFIVAVSAQYFDSFPGAGPNPNANPVCGRTIQANYQGRTVNVQVTDRCVGCAYADLDLSPAAFAQLADPSVGRIHGVSWNML